MAANQAEDPAAIQEDVERTQDAMGETVEKLEQKLNPRNITESLLGPANAATAHDAWDVIRESPLPVAMILSGTVWLFATSDAPLVTRARRDLIDRLRDAFGSGGSGAGLRSRSDEPAPIGPPPATGEAYDRRAGQPG